MYSEIGRGPARRDYGGPSIVHLPTADHCEPLVLSAHGSLTSIQRPAQNLPRTSANNMTPTLRDDGIWLTEYRPERLGGLGEAS
jgi:hypothetical protein